MQAVSNEAKAVQVAATFQTIEEAAGKLDGAREEAAATIDAVAQVRTPDAECQYEETLESLNIVAQARSFTPGCVGRVAWAHTL